MTFKMNNRTWEILEKPAKYIQDVYKQKTDEEPPYLFGLSVITDHIVYLNNEMCSDKARQTLLHELMHCYKTEYVSMSIDKIDEEILCDISANSHDIIHEIVEEYFKEKKKHGIMDKKSK